MARGSAGGAQFGLIFSDSVKKLTVPPAANVAEGFVRTAPVNFTRDGTDPTTGKGFTAYPVDVIVLNSRDECEKFEGIRATNSDATVDWEYFSDVSG